MKNTFAIKIVAEEGAEGPELWSVEAQSNLRQKNIDGEQRRALDYCQRYCAEISRTTPQMIDDIFCLCFGLDVSADLPADRYDEAIEWFNRLDLKRFIQ